MQDAEFDVQKFDGLARTGSVATETLRKATVRVDVARATIDKARSALAAAEAQKSYATITSPVDGVIVTVARRSGEMATAGSAILTVESREVLLFKAFVSESNLSAIDPATPVTVRIDTLKDSAFQGRIRGIVPSGDAQISSSVLKRSLSFLALPLRGAVVSTAFLFLMVTWRAFAGSARGVSLATPSRSCPGCRAVRRSSPP